MSSDCLFAAPRFLFGAARTLDLGATFDEYNVSRSPTEADFRAIASDWYVVGRDLEAAIRAYGARWPSAPKEEDHEAEQLDLVLTP